MNAASRRFAMRSLGVAGYIALAVAVVPVGGALLSYNRAASIARLHHSALDATEAAMNADPVAGFFRTRSSNDAERNYREASNDFWSAEQRRRDSASRILHISVLSLAPLAVAGACFWTRRFLKLGAGET